MLNILHYGWDNSGERRNKVIFPSPGQPHDMDTSVLRKYQAVEDYQTVRTSQLHRTVKYADFPTNLIIHKILVVQLVVGGY
ncbi:hypothetical protein J6590_088306 [Homalodisca vitripennis]|nr:hypothetical protein J6590_088306 [Homalodisca vitripennis]